MYRDTAVSAKFIDALQRHPERAYRLWWRAGVAPTTGSKLIHGAALVHRNDPRIVAVGKLLGLAADECFEPATDDDRLVTPVPVERVSA